MIIYTQHTYRQADCNGGVRAALDRQTHAHTHVYMHSNTIVSVLCGTEQYDNVRCYGIESAEE